jgi:hypothetical protein
LAFVSVVRCGFAAYKSNDMMRCRRGASNDLLAATWGTFPTCRPAWSNGWIGDGFGIDLRGAVSVLQTVKFFAWHEDSSTGGKGGNRESDGDVAVLSVSSVFSCSKGCATQRDQSLAAAGPRWMLTASVP